MEESALPICRNFIAQTSLEALRSDGGFGFLERHLSTAVDREPVKILRHWIHARRAQEESEARSLPQVVDIV